MSLNRRTASAALAAAAILNSARQARTHKVGTIEESVFRTWNDLPDRIHPPVWAIMQSGSLAAVFVTAAELLRREQKQTAATTLIAGTIAWGGVKAIKPLVGRGRPEHLLDGVAVRGHAQTGLGFPSGHAAVAATIAITATASSRPAVHAAAAAIVGTTGLARMYVGAHLPHDVVGGLAIGLLWGRAANNALRRYVSVTGN
jgi:membrane-associated phospholipid phosphatase